MTNREKLWFLIDALLEHKIRIDKFCDDFNRIYNLEIDYSELSKEEHNLFRELNITAGRFSQYEEDLKITNVYYSEEEVRSEAAQVRKNLRGF